MEAAPPDFGLIRAMVGICRRRGKSGIKEVGFSSHGGRVERNLRSVAPSPYSLTGRVMQTKRLVAASIRPRSANLQTNPTCAIRFG